MQKCYRNTDVGMHREKNEDYYKVCTYGGYNIYIVADGMGGYYGGEIASKLAVQTVQESIEDAIDKKLIESPNGIGLTIIDAIKRANTKIFEFAKQDSKYKNMGTTIVVAIEKEDKLYFATVGDSRLYKKDTKFKQISKDDTYVAALLKDNVITKEEAKVHPQRHMLTKALGVGKKVDLSYNEIKIKNGDIILMCTDGITNMIEDAKIDSILEENRESSKDVALLLTEKANENGGADNSTAIVIYI